MLSASTSFEFPRPLGHYTLLGLLGQGGMGIVYAARDERLGRDVAIKMIAESDATAVKRFWREARSAAAVSHPNVCQIFDVEETQDGMFLAMERLAGESLEVRLLRGTLPPMDAARIGCEVLGALGALHRCGLVHRDVKPSNVFLTPHGAKLLDFGLARSAVADVNEAVADASLAVTQPGMILGTALYMAPEQVQGGPIDGRADLHALGAVLFEALAGRPPFLGTVLQVLYAVVRENPPALEGPPVVVALDRVIRRAMAKNPDHRYADAATMAADLRAVSADDALHVVPHAHAPAARALTRVVVPPFRLGRPDPEIDFLSFSLADVLSGSLASLDGVVVRSTSAAASVGGTDTAEPDLRRIGAAADVDLVLLGALRRSGPRLRATLQLAETLSRSVVGAQTVEGDLADVFALEDALQQAAHELLAPRAAGPRERRPAEEPPNPAAFEHFLRATELARRMPALGEARELFERAVAEAPRFAPAWAGLGRACHMLAKFAPGEDALRERAADAFRRALEIDPDLSQAHRNLTGLETDAGRAEVAVARLLSAAGKARNDALLFAGLVHACRYAGLLDASVAAHDEARRLDPAVPTSVAFTLTLAGDLERLDVLVSAPGGVDPLAYTLALGLAGRGEEAVAIIDRLDLAKAPGRYRLALRLRRAVATGAHDELLAIPDADIAGMRDAEAFCMFGLAIAHGGDAPRALGLLNAAVAGGYTPVATLERHPTLAGVRALPAFAGTLEVARARRRAAAEVFARGGGATLLGLPPDAAME